MSLFIGQSFVDFFLESFDALLSVNGSPISVSGPGTVLGIYTSLNSDWFFASLLPRVFCRQFSKEAFLLVAMPVVLFFLKKILVTSDE